MRKLLSYTICGVLCLSLAGCGKTSEKKTDFVVDVYNASRSGQIVTITKPGKVLGAEEVTVTSQVSGRIKKKMKKDGDKVAYDEYILSIDDSIGNYGLQVARARNALGRAVIQYNQTKVSIDKGLSDTTNALDAAQNAYTSSQNSLLLQFDVQKKSLLSSLDTILHQLDTYLGVSHSYELYNQTYDLYLGGKNPSQRTNTEKELSALYTLRDKVKAISSNSPSFDQIVKNLPTMDSAYNQARVLLDDMTQVLVNSISCVQLPQGTIDGYKANVDGLKAGLQGGYASFTAYRTQVDNQHNANQDGVPTEDIGVKNAQSAYNSFVENKDLQINMSRTSIADAQIGYLDALTRFDKLGVRSPITGVIGSILVDEGQEVGPGTPLFTLAGNQEQLVEVYVSADEMSFLKVNQPAWVSYNGETFSGKISSLSPIAERTTLYKVVVSLATTTSMFGDVALVTLPIGVNTPVIPINAVVPLANNSGFVRVIQGSGLQRYDIHMGRVWDDKVQIDSSLPEGLQVVVSDVSAYDPEKFALKIK